MIAALTGPVLARAEDAVYVWANQVAYEVRCPSSVRFEDVVFTWHVIREAEQYLLGFSTDEDRRLAIVIGDTDGVGPKTAAKLVWSAGASTILTALRTGDAKVIPKVTGCGPTTIANVLAHLKKVGFQGSEDPRVAQAIQLHRAIYGSISDAFISNIEKKAAANPGWTAQQLQALSNDLTANV